VSARETDKDEEVWGPRRKDRPSGRRRALSSTRTRDRAEGASWTDGLVSLPSAPGTLTNRGIVASALVRSVGPHGCTVEIASSGPLPAIGAELHVGVPAAPVQPGLLTVVGNVARLDASNDGIHHLVGVELSSHGGVPAAYWDLVSHWAETRDD